MALKKLIKKSDKPAHIIVREAAAGGDAGFRFFTEYGRLPQPEDDTSPFYVCPHKEGDMYIGVFTNKPFIWHEGQWKEVMNTEPAVDDHFNVDDDDLNMLLNLAGDLLTDQGNMDTALMFAHYLEKVEERLKTNG
ncbi:hypothetical protein D3C75_447110 [compost metagenome]